jgi:hypothetical protein
MKLLNLMTLTARERGLHSKEGGVGAIYVTTLVYQVLVQFCVSYKKGDLRG